MKKLLIAMLLICAPVLANKSDEPISFVSRDSDSLFFIDTDENIARITALASNPNVIFNDESGKQIGKLYADKDGVKFDGKVEESAKQFWTYLWKQYVSCPDAEASEIDFVPSYEYYQQPNKGNNYDSGMGYSLGIQHGIYGDLKGRADFTYITDVDFPTDSDPKGSFGELRGYGGIYNLIFNLVYNKNLSFNLNAGAGPVFWGFRSNPNYQDAHITVKVKPSLVMKVGGGAEVKLYDKWHLNLGVGWLDTQIGKKVTDASGNELNQLDAGDEIGLQYITWKIGIRKEF